MKIAPSLQNRPAVHFDFLHEDERCRIFFRRHGMCLVFQLGKSWIPPAFFFLVLLPLFSWMFRNNGTESSFSFIIFSTAIIVATLLVHLLYLHIISYLLGFMMVTDRRIIEVHKSVFLREEMNEIPFDHITNLHHEKKGLLQNILRYGILRIDSNVGKPIRMHFVPCVEDKFAKISMIYGRYVTTRNHPRSEDLFYKNEEPSNTNNIRVHTRSFFRRTFSHEEEVM